MISEEEETKRWSHGQEGTGIGYGQRNGGGMPARREERWQGRSPWQWEGGQRKPPCHEWQPECKPGAQE